jgi:RHS repeat-associated protein
MSTNVNVLKILQAHTPTNREGFRMRSVAARRASIARWFLLGLLLCGTAGARAATVATVGTSTNNSSTAAAHERKAFYANGRHWVFFADGSNMVFQSSTNGTTWNSKTTVRACTTGPLFGLAYDGTYVHYAYAKAAVSNALFYRRGLPNADGTITWSAAEQTVVAASSANIYKSPAIAVDSTGAAWIGYLQDAASDYPFVTRSSTTNGTWTTASSFPHQLSTTTSTSWAVTPVALQSGRMLVLYTRGGAKASSKLWKGTAWASARALFTGYNVYSTGVRASAVAVGDDVHLVYQKVSTYAVQYVKFTYSSSDTTYYGSWGGEAALQAGVTATTVPVLARDGATNDLYCFWAGSPTANHIYYKKRTAAGGWDTSPTDWHNQSAEALTAYDRITAYAGSGGNTIGVLFSTKTASPYNVRLAQLMTAGCGNGSVEAGEQCDGGACCSAACTFVAGGTTCRASVGACDLPESCTGASGACPADAFATAGTVCRVAAGACDQAETCTGSSTTCPNDGFLAAGTVCRPSAGSCDVAETCNGSSVACPADGFASAATTCRASGGVCDVAENCTGIDAVCPADVKVAAGTTCRASAGACDLAETCTGLQDACPVDSKLAAGTVCREALSVCDLAETCDGAANTCPVDALVTNGSACPGGTCQSGVCIEQLSSSWSDIGTHPLGAQEYSVTRLADGRMLVAGGRICTPNCTSWTVVTEVYIFSGGTFTLWGNLAYYYPSGSTSPHSRYGHTSLLLNDGRVVLYDGWQSPNRCRSDIAVIDVAAGTWSTRNPGPYWGTRCGYPATVLDNGKLLMTGGYLQDGATLLGPYQDGRLWDPVADTWTELYPSWNYGPTIARQNHYQVKLPDGKVLIGGGGTLATEIFDPAGVGPYGAYGTFAATSNNPSRVRSKNGAVLVPSGPYAGKVLVFGGVSPNAEGEQCDRCSEWIVDDDYHAGGYWIYYQCAFHACTAGASQYTHRTDLFDPATNTWSAPGGALDLPAQRATFGVGVVGGQIIAAGGNSNGSEGLMVHKFDLAAGSWSAMTNLPAARIGPTVAALINQAALVAGPSGAFYQYNFSTCGNGTKGSTEQCDEGLANGTAGSCCNADCTLKTAGTVCRAAAGECDVADACTGTSGACPADAKVANGTSCTDRTWGDCSRAACMNGVCDQTAGSPMPAGTQCRWVSECGGNAYCDGTTRVCPDSYQPAGTACTPAQCDECDGWPSCESRWCYKHTVCTGAAYGCPTSCSTDANCQPGYACLDQTCQAKQANGAACTNGALCQSGNCVDGFCCNTACNGACEACASAKTGAANGTCAGVVGNTDPDAECGGGLTCNGARACRTTCASTTECEAGYTCIGGACLPPAGTCSGGNPPGSLEEKQEAGGGADRVNEAFGSLAHSIQVQVPGYHGIEPVVALGYGSGSGNGDAGLGWNLSGEAVIERGSKGHGAPRYDATDVYFMDGQELVSCAGNTTSPSCTTCPSGYTCYATKIESYLRIGQMTASPYNWVVWQKNGVKSTLTAKLTTPSGKTFRWMLSTVEDLKSNVVTYGWSCDGTSPILDCYLATITYNGTVVTFYYVSRSDVQTFATGEHVGQTRWLLRTIGVAVSGTTARAYYLQYGTASTGGAQALLQSVTQYGRGTVVNSDGSIASGQALPAQTFSWTQPGGLSAETPLTPNQFYAQAGDEGHKKGLGDVNGDGRQDYCYIRSGYREVWCRLGTATGLAAGETRWVDYSAAPGIGDVNVWGFADLNGDGKDDFFYKGDNGKNLYVGLSNGAGFDAVSYWGAFSYDIAGNNSQWYMVDVNHDGRMDFVYQRSASNSPRYLYALLSNGTSFAAERYLLTHTYDSQGSGSTSRNWFADVNGDGCPDYVYKSSSTSVRVALSNWCQGVESYQADAQWGTATDSNDWGMAADVNGDGKADYVQSTGNVLKVLLSTGTSFAAEASWGTHSYNVFKVFKWFTDVDGDGVVDFVYNASGSTALYVLKGTGTSFGAQSLLLNRSYDAQGTDANNNMWFADFTGDGRPDFLYRRASTYELLMFTTQGAGAVLMTGLTNGIGGSTSVEYQPSTQWQNTNNPPLMQTVTRVTESDGRGNSSVTDYAYAGGLYDRVQGRFLSFYYNKTTLPCITGESACPYTETWYQQDYASATKVYRADRRDGAGRLLASQIEGYSLAGNGSTVPYTSLHSTTTIYAYDGSGNACPSWPCAFGRRIYTGRSFDAWGNPTVEASWGDQDASGDERTKAWIYVPNASLFITGLKAVERLHEGTSTAGTVLEEALTSYDGNTTWNAAPTAGLPTKTQRMTSTTPSYQETSQQYDAWGNVTKEISPLGHETVHVIDPTYHLYRVETRDALYASDNRHKKTMTVDPVFGAETGVTEMSGLAVTRSYDVFGRLTRVEDNAGAWENHSYPNFGDPQWQYKEVQKAPPTGVSGNLWSREYFDGFGRVYYTYARGPSAGGNIEAWTTFNARGKVATQDAQHFVGGPAATGTFYYDSMDRVTRQLNPDGVTFTTKSYGLGSITYTDECGGQVSEWRDGLGRLTQRRQWRDGRALDTLYQFNVRGQMTQVTDPKGNVYKVTYNPLGQKASYVDPDRGTTTYAYDVGGRLTEVTDALGQKLVFAYDALNRKLTETQKVAGGAVQQTVTWTYDEARGTYANVGGVTTMVDGSGTATFDYDLRGNLVKAYRSLTGGSTYTFQSTYDAAGRLLTSTLPDGEVVGPRTYDETGALKAIPGYVTDVTYDARGQILTLTRADGTVTTNTYDASRLWLKKIETKKGTTTLLSLDYTRDALGRISQVASPFADESWTYSYDSVGALIAANSGSHSQSYTYDDTGNLVSQVRPAAAGGGAWSYVYNSAHGPASVRPHAVTQAGSKAFSYDAVGNMVSREGQTLTWGVNGLPLTVGGATATSFVYDGHGARVKKVYGATTTWYPSPDYEVTGGTVTKYVRMGSMAVAKVVGGTTYFLHPDGLGSTRVITDSAGLEVQRIKYRPYGERLSTSTSHAEARGFTGQREDECGLIFLNARYYDPQLGRFISADPTLPSSNVIGLNRYAYAGNDPVNHLDTNGLSFFSRIWKAVKKAVNGIVATLKAAAHGDWKAILTIVIMIATIAVGGMVMSNVVSSMLMAQGTMASCGLAGSLIAGNISAMTAAFASGSAAVMGAAVATGGAIGAVSGFLTGFVQTGSLRAAGKAALNGFIGGAFNSAANLALMATGIPQLSTLMTGTNATEPMRSSYLFNFIFKERRPIQFLGGWLTDLKGSFNTFSMNANPLGALSHDGFMKYLIKPLLCSWTEGGNFFHVMARTVYTWVNTLTASVWAAGAEGMLLGAFGITSPTATTMIAPVTSAGSFFLLEPIRYGGGMHISREQQARAGAHVSFGGASTPRGMSPSLGGG